MADETYDPTTADVVSNMDPMDRPYAPAWGGLAQYFPKTTGWPAILQQYLGKALTSVPEPAMMAAGFLTGSPKLGFLRRAAQPISASDVAKRQAAFDPEAPVASLEPRSQQGLSLSENFANQSPASPGKKFQYMIYHNGEPIGDAMGGVLDNKAWIEHMGVNEGEFGLGVSGIRQLRELIRNDFPEVNIFEGHRISGARQGPAAAPQKKALQSIKMDADGGSVDSILSRYR